MKLDDFYVEEARKYRGLYFELVKKIHEKIEELETCISMNKQNKHFIPEENKIMDVVLLELKSLLEDNKK